MKCWCNGKCPNVRRARRFANDEQWADAEMALKRVLADAPTCSEANRVMAHVLCETNRGAFAFDHIRRVMDDPPTSRDLVNLGEAFRANGRVKEALDSYEQARSLDPENGFAHLGVLGALEADGQLDRAAAEGGAALILFPNMPEIRRRMAKVHAARDDYDAAIALLADNNQVRPIDILDRGRYRDKMKDYAGAWSDWTYAKARLRRERGHVYKRQHVADMVSGLYEFASPTRLKMMPTANNVMRDSPQPVFITGHPRSGTTMVETALSFHSRVAPGDELAFLPELVNRSPQLLRSPLAYPAALNAMSLGDNFLMPDLFNSYYLSRAYRRIGADLLKGKTLFTDKMPLNELHLPLIHIVFPWAPVLYVRRHPLDIFLSNWSNYLIHGWQYAAALDTTAEFYVLLDQLLQHYKRRLPQDRFREVRYEDFVSDHRTAIDGMLDFCKLDPEDQVYDFHNNPRYSRTISYSAVKQPLYDSSVGRWKNYADQLAPVIDLVRPILKREGYDV